MSIKKADNRPNFPEIEKRIAGWWEENDTFARSVKQREGAEGWRFYDGPPFVSGMPHYGHIKDQVVKDAVPRYWTMKGYHIPRVWGWDCHGLPIENKVEKKLNIKSKLEIEEFGVDKYIEECYNYTRETSAEWPWYVKRMGRWIDYDHAYRTMDQNYMETIWWVFKSLYEKGLIYKGMRSSLYSTDSATPVSNFEIAMDNTYEDVDDDAVTVKFKAKKNELLPDGAHFLSWTTTPWTLPANFALAVNPEEDYALVETSLDGTELVGVWLVEGELPFDSSNFQKEKIIRNYLSFAGEKVESNSQLELSKSTSFEALTELELAVVKVGKKFYFSQDGELLEISQKNYQKLLQESIAKVEFERIYYPLNEERSESVDISKKAAEQHLRAEIETYTSGNLSGLTLIRVSFNSPVEYVSLKSKLPDWFGTELTNSEAIKPSEFSKSNKENIENLANAELTFEDLEQFKQHLVLAYQLAEQNIKGDYVVKDLFKGSDLVGIGYEQLYPFLEGGENDFQIYGADIVTVEDGTGVLHVAPAYGEEDFELGKKYGISFKQVIDDAGLLLPEIEPFAGLYLRDAALPIINDLKERGKLYKAEKYTHRLPFYRYENPLIYRAQESWFIDVQKLKNQLIAENEKINWVPDHLQHGRFLKGIESAPDWSISRSRFWATTMPVWASEDPENEGQVKPNYEIGEVLVVGSRDELREHAIQPVTKIRFKHTEDGKAKKDILREMSKILEEKEGEELELEISNEDLAKLKVKFERKSEQEATDSMKGLEGIYEMYFFEGELLDLHKNGVDKLKLKHPETGATLVRVPDVLDNWLDSGSMPFAQLHYPFENEQNFKQNYPADFIVEYIAQTRAWFYVMHVLGVALSGKRSFKNVVTSGVISGSDGRKMSKTYGNYPDPKATLEKYGSEAMRWYFLTSKLIQGEDINFDEKALRDQIRLYILPLWNVYSFFTIYAQLHKWAPNKDLLSNNPDTKRKGEKNIFGGDVPDTFWYKVPFPSQVLKNKLDQWILAKLQQTIYTVRSEMDQYNIPRATREIQDFVAVLSKSYVRRSRERFANGDEQAMNVMYHVLVELTKLTAPFTPFVAEEIYQELVSSQLENQPESVHLTDYPEADMEYLENNSKLMRQFEQLDEIIELGQTLRTQYGIKIRQPLAEIQVKVIVENSRDKELEKWMQDLISQELNIKQVKEISRLPEVWEKSEEEVQKNTWQTSDGWLIARSLNPRLDIDLALDSNLSKELEEEGWIRELTRTIQALRKSEKMDLEDKVIINASFSSKEKMELVERNKQEIMTTVGASTIRLTEVSESKLSGKPWLLEIESK